MGDEELNFTEEEAQCWADDPRNQEARGGVMVSVIVAFVLFLIAIVTITLVRGSGASASDRGETHAGVLLVP